MANWRKWLYAGPDEAPPVHPAPVRSQPLIPRVRSGTVLEQAEIAWISEGVSRETALSIPAVAACRNLIVGTVAQLDLFRYRGAERLAPDYLMTRPDPSTTLAATVGGTVDDLVFYGRAYWRILDRDPEGFPRRARWTPFQDVTPELRSTGGSYSDLTGYRIAGVSEVVEPADVIRFDSPIPGVLDVGGRTLASALDTYAAQRRFAGVDLPAGVLENLGDELSEEELAELLQGFLAQRQQQGVAILQGLKYSREQLSPADLQLIEMTDSIATEVARLFNVPVAMIGASPSGNASALLYSNLSQQLAILVSSAVAPHLVTIELTLSDCYPRGTSVAFDVQTFLRSDPQAAADYATGLFTAELISRDEARAMLGIPTAPAAELTL